MIPLVLFLLFTVVPAIELWLLIEIGQVIGGWETVAWVVLMGALGAWLGKRAGFQVLRELFAAVQEGRSPANQLVEAGLVLGAAILLITPGVLTDIVGTAIFLPPVRRWLAPRVKDRLLAWMVGRGVQVGPIGPGPAHPSRQSEDEPPRKVHGFQHPVV
jgi:UPF0716 protein FxsA